MAADEQDDKPSREQAEQQGGLRQVARDRANLADSPIGVLTRFIRDLATENQSRKRKP